MRHDEVRRLHSQVVEAVVSLEPCDTPKVVFKVSFCASERDAVAVSYVGPARMALGREAARTPVESWLKHLFSSNFKLLQVAEHSECSVSFSRKFLTFSIRAKAWVYS